MTVATAVDLSKKIAYGYHQIPETSPYFLPLINLENELVEADSEILKLSEQLNYIQITNKLKQHSSPIHAELAALKNAFGIEILRETHNASNEPLVKFKLFFDDSTTAKVLEIIMEMSENGLQIVSCTPQLLGIDAILFDFKSGETLQLIANIRHKFKQEYST
jgi:hypothetical protein